MLNRNNVTELANVMEVEPRPHGVGFDMACWLLLPEAVLDKISNAGAANELSMAESERIDYISKLCTCGTAGCIAGHAVIHFDGLAAAIDRWVVRSNSISYRARDLLGLTPAQADALFQPVGVGIPNKAHAVQMLRWLAAQPPTVTAIDIANRWYSVAGRSREDNIVQLESA